MPLLAISDTPLSRRLILEGRLEVDLFETSGPLTEGAAESLAPTRVPFLLHNGVWNWSLGDPEALLDPDVLTTTKERLALTQAPWLSVHLGYSSASVAFEKGSGFVPAPHGSHSNTPPLERSALLSVLGQNIRALQDALAVPLLIENLEYNPTGAYEHISEAAFIAEVLAATGVGLLLDLAHAQVSASRLDQDISAYLTKLPLERVKQLHVSGPRTDRETLFDAHEPLRETDYALLSEVLHKTDVWAVTLEYGKDEDELLGQVRRLRQLLST